MNTFENYSARRGYSLENFTHLSYEAFTAWCHERNVAPVSRSQFNASQSGQDSIPSITEFDSDIDTDDFSLEPTLDLEPIQTAVQVNPIDWKNLQKRRKQDIQAMCESRGIDYSDETKRQLILKLKTFEGIE